MGWEGWVGKLEEEGRAGGGAGGEERDGGLNKWPKINHVY